MSVNGKPYGSEYTTVLEVKNIKYVIQNDKGSVKTPMETKTQGRVYVTVNHDNTVKAITYYDNELKRNKQIDVAGQYHKVNGKSILPHTHKGYLHDEKGTFALSTKEKRMVARVLNIWDNYIS